MEVTDDQIVKAIAQHLGIASVLSLVGRRVVAQKFMNHAMRLIVTHRDICERWLEKHQAKEFSQCSQCL